MPFFSWGGHLEEEQQHLSHHHRLTVRLVHSLTTQLPYYSFVLTIIQFVVFVENLARVGDTRKSQPNKQAIKQAEGHYSVTVSYYN